MVMRLVAAVAVRLGLDPQEQRRAELAAQVRDIGMLALPDSVLHDTGALSPGGWEALERHPALGAELLAGLEATEALAPIVRGHHERWDGEGYPDGLKGHAIPTLARVIATCDAFVAIASDRPHRRGSGAEAALEHLEQESERQFDPAAVCALIEVVSGRSRGSGRGPAGAPEPPTTGAGDLGRAMTDLDVIPAFSPARERLLAATGPNAGGVDGDLVATVESDTGLTVAVLRAAQDESRRRQPASISDAVAVLSSAQLHELAMGLPAAPFPWRSPVEALMHRLRVHAHVVARAAERLAREVKPTARDELLAAALLHDVGKLVIARARGEYDGVAERSILVPEERLRRERRQFGTDHASLGSILIQRWGLPERLAEAVAGHHRARDECECATLVRLADMVAHQAQGGAVDRRIMLQLAGACGLSTREMRDAIFDLPHVGGSRRRRAERSPLSTQETAVLQQLAQGKLYKQIAEDLRLSPSTVRSHLHNAYRKLEVPDRAQAVLRATEMAWI